ncbi:Sodium- and chloride-dependent glycine transporter 2 [Brachionus plicatilis]|uniref:Sodium-and chloride-dependent glycine transporter 2 n=1 Tax=Brachionus plicatilis TaxID=10195 RepID=A0A3M7R3W6_BRAPC|nr:Sodium- and chloride-dependent glycine transporter 2 [Brachionus plicatilis]
MTKQSDKHVHLPHIHLPHHRKEWSNPIEFLMTCIGFAVGLGNVWRFPYLCFKNGGSAFVIAFLSMLFIIGLPLFFLEISLAQYSKFGPLEIWKAVPMVRGIGICSLLIACIISLYYNILIAYSLIYAISSFLPTLPWTKCGFYWNNAKCCVASSTIKNISGVLTSVSDCSFDSESPAKQYFNNYVLNISNGIEELGEINWKVAVSLLVCWLLIFLSLSKGVQSLGKVSYLTAIFPYVMIIALIIRGVTLEGAMNGIEYFILKINTEKLKSLETWVDAANQVYFCLSISQGGLYTLGRHNSFNYNHQRTSTIVAILDGFTGILAGLAIFSVLGYMSHKTGIEVKDLAVGGPGLSFIVYPEALSLMPFPWIWCIFFFLMMITIGFGSILSWMECVLDSGTEILKKHINSEKKKTIFRLSVCMLFFLLGLLMATRSGLYIQNFLDFFVTGYPVLICAALESFSIGWIYGVKRLKEDIKLMLGHYPNIYWVVCYKILTPLGTFAAVLLSLIANSKISLNDYQYPMWSQIVGYIIVVLVLSPIPIFFIVSVKRIGLKNILKPEKDWLPAIKKEPTNVIAMKKVDGIDNISFREEINF